MSSQTDQAKPTCEFDEVRNQELSLIASRRRAAASHPQSEPAVAQPSNDPQDLSAELTGLALSGGGVRSAAFNLGLLQALYDKDLLRQVDYLSTVSGGGYVGAHLSSLAMHPDSQFSWQEQSVSPTQGLSAGNGSPRISTEKCVASPKSPAPSSTSACSRDKNPVTQTLGKGNEGIRAKAGDPNGIELIARDCRYLTQPSHFLNRQLIGALCLNVVTIAGLVTFVALAAWSFRTLDSQPAIRFLDTLMIRSDISRALLPAFVLFGLWLLSWAVAFFRDRGNAKGEIAKFFLMSWIAAFFLGIAALAGNGEVAISPSLDPKYGIDYSDTVTWFFKQIGTAGLIAILGGLLPYLNPRALMRSATVNRRGVQGLVYRTATKAMLFGVPLLLFWYIASEDIAGSNTSRTDQIFPDGVKRAEAKLKAKKLAQPADLEQVSEEQFRETWDLRKKDLEYNTTYDLHLASITNPGEFWPLVEKSSVATPGRSIDSRLPERSLHKIPQRLADELQKARKNAITKLRDDPQAQQRRFEELVQSESFWSVGFSCVRYLVGDTETLFELQLDRKEAIDQGNAAIAQQINADVLANARLYQLLGISNPETFDSLMEKEKDTKKLDELRQVRELIQNAISLEAELTDIQGSIKSTLSQKGGLLSSTDIKVAVLKFEQVLESLRNALRLSPATSSLKVEQVLAALLKVKPQSLPSDNLDKLREQIRRLVRLSEQIRKNNRQILEFYCQNHLKPPTTVYAAIVQPADQAVRWHWALIAGGIWLLSSGLISLNAISLQAVYRDALSQAWIVDPTQKRGSSMNLHELSEVAAHGCPYHLMTGAMSFGTHFGFTTADPFLFSPLFCGSETTGYVRSSRYASGRLTLPDAMAISGAAVAPPQIDDLLGRILLTLANCRMGAWLPNPRKPCWHIDIAAQPVVPQVLRRLWTSYPQTAGRVHLQWILWQWFLPAEQTPFLYLSDGGHYENLGIGELLRRRCRLIIASDAGEDSGYQFEDFIKAVHAGNSRVRIEEMRQHRALFSRLVPDADTHLSERHFVVMKVEYLDVPADDQRRVGYLIYIKPTLTGDEDSGLRGFRSLNSEFPHDPTANQLFEDDKFEAYRRLGYHIAEQLADELNGPKDVPFWLGRWSPPIGPNGKPSGPSQATIPADAAEAADEVARLFKIARDPNQEMLQRFYATRVLIADHFQHAIDRLRDLIHDPHPDVATCAIKALPLASESSVSLLVHALSSQDGRARAEALRLINQLKPMELKSNTDDLLRGLRDTLRRKTKGKPRPADIEILDDGAEILEKLSRGADRLTRHRIDELLKDVHAEQRISDADFDARN